MKMTT